MDSIVFNRIKELCAEKGITITKLESLMKMSQSTIGKWRTATPTVDKLVKVAQYFHVSLDYITGLSNIRETAEHISKDTRFQTITAMWEQLSERDKDYVEITMMMHIDHDKFNSNFTERLTKLVTSYEESQKEAFENGKPQDND